MNNYIDLEYSRAKISAATRKWLMRCSYLHRLGHDEVDADPTYPLRLVRPEGENC
jgi:hypothetical protein